MATTDTPEASPPKTPESSPSPPKSSGKDWAQILLSRLDAINGSLNLSASAKTKGKKGKKEEQDPETAVDDTEDLFDDDVVEEKRKTGGYIRRRLSNNLRSGRHGGNADAETAPRKFAKVEAVLPFAFHPNVQPLTISDLESCVALENAAFPDPEHRCTREKFEYRLRTCPELCLGLFCTVVPSEIKDTGFEIETLPTAHPVETNRADGAKSVLLAHIVATRSNDEVVTDAAMDYPRDFRTRKGRNDTGLGHQADGKTVCLHSVAVHPKLHGRGLGKLIMKAYLQQQKGSAAAERCALICQNYLVRYYERFGFEHRGPSQSAFGGGGWHDMVIDVEDMP
ncbi:hypothetical protein Hte_005527 [Hypoxylon texense]